MLLSENWLAEWVFLPAGHTERLTQAGLELESRRALAGFSQVVVAEVEQVEPHPNADRLRLCQVSTGQQRYQVVCGAPNVRVGLKAPLALVGASLPGGITIRASKIRGQSSSGMLCSASELALAQSAEAASGLLELADDAPLGQELATYLALDDHLLSLKVTPNRGDCLSVIGVAREISALHGQALAPYVAEPVAVSLPAEIELALEHPAACPLYCGRLITGLAADRPTPAWMRQRLEKSGIRPISLVVDITQYVMLELGQPMHAFNAAAVGRRLGVRQGHSGERLTLLNGQTVDVSGAWLIADEHRALAAAGVMGGLDSAFLPQHSSVFLESAYFPPATVAGRTRQWQLNSEAAYRYERGVDPAIQLQALERASALVLRYAGGQAAAVVQQRVGHSPSVVLSLRAQRVKKILGRELQASQISSSLHCLGCELTPQEAGQWQVTPPSWRPDLEREIDLIEEIARWVGYDTLGESLPANCAGFHPEPVRSTAALLDHAKARGFQQIISMGFVPEKINQQLAPQAQALAVANPMSRDLSVMRCSLWPSLVMNLSHNKAYMHERARIHEVGRVFELSGAEVQEQLCWGGLLWGAVAPDNWLEARRGVDFFDGKAELEALWEGLKPELSYQAQSHPALHPGQSARLYVADQAIGWLGVLHPQLTAELGLGTAPVLWQVALEPWLSAEAASLDKAAVWSKQPSIRRDIAWVMPLELVAEEFRNKLLAALPAQSQALVKQFSVFDLYRSERLGDGFKCLTFKLILQHPSAALADAQADDIVLCLQQAAAKLGAQLRQ